MEQLGKRIALSHVKLHHVNTSRSNRKHPNWKHDKLAWFVHGPLEPPRASFVPIYRALVTWVRWSACIEPEGY